MKDLLTATVLTLSTVVATSSPALADTYAVVINTLDEPINLNCAKVEPGDSAWTPLKANNERHR